MSQQAGIEVAVVMERIAAPNAWEAWQHRVVEVVPGEGVFGATPRMLHDDGKTSRWLHPGFKVDLFADECKGYFLNLTSGRPAWFVSWVEDDADPSRVAVTAVSLSYIEADRRLTAEERVENLPLEPELCEWLRLFTNEHFRPDTGRKVRAQSFLSPEERSHQIGDAAAPAPQAERAAHEQMSLGYFAHPPRGADDVCRRPGGAHEQMSLGYFAHPPRGGEPAPSERLRAREWLANARRPASRRADDVCRRPGGALTGPQVDAQARNAALRKLFQSDPHFSASDGLDAHADEAAAGEHAPLERQRQILRARALGLLDDELADQDEPSSTSPDATGPARSGGGYRGPK